MKTQNAPIEMNTATIRAGVISLAVFSICYIGMTGGGGIDGRHVWWFIISFAVAFVLMMSSIVDLFVLTFTFAMRYSGKGLGRATKLVRRITGRVFSRVSSAI